MSHFGPVESFRIDEYILLDPGCFCSRLLQDKIVPRHLTAGEAVTQELSCRGDFLTRTLLSLRLIIAAAMVALLAYRCTSSSKP